MGIQGYRGTGIEGYGDTVHAALPYFTSLSLLLFLTRAVVSCYGVLGRIAKETLKIVK